LERSALGALPAFLLLPFEARGAAVVFPRPPAADDEGGAALWLDGRDAAVFPPGPAAADLLRDDAFFELFVFGLMDLSRLTGAGR